MAACLIWSCSRRDGDGKTAIPLGASEVPPVLLFDGKGTSVNDVAAIESLLAKRRIPYSTANASQLNAMEESRLKAYRLLIFPGGNFLTIGSSLGPVATARIHSAVQGGLNYLGICAGGFFAGRYMHAGEESGLNLTSGVGFGFYDNQGGRVRKGAVPIACGGRPVLEQYWEDGPQFNGWGAVVCTYPDGNPAIVEGAFGKGWVVLSGVHPEAPERWRRGMEFSTPASVDHAFADSLIDAALNRTPLSHP